MKTNHAESSIIYAGKLATASLLVLSSLYMLAEPQVTRGQADTSEFVITQIITAESSFLVEPTDVSMVGSIAGLTGGQATGTTDFVVQSNNSNGYYVDISFFNNGTDNAMLGTSTASEAIRDYDGDAAGPEPSRGYVSSTSAQFAYTVASDVSADTDQSFFHDGATCNSGVLQTETCWKSPSTAAFEIVRRTSPALTGATSTITFNVTVPSGASPVPQSDGYVATATLSLYNL